MMEQVALEVAWRDPFSDAPVEGDAAFQRAVLEKRAGVRMLLAQNADFGARAWEHFLRNVRELMKVSYKSSWRNCNI